MDIKKTENLANVATTLLRMTFREVTDLAEQIDSDGDKLLDFAERYVAPTLANQGVNLAHAASE